MTAEVEQTMKHDRYLSSHYRYYIREMRILAYTQLLESYRSLTLDYMSKAFGVTTDFIDQYVSSDQTNHFISIFLKVNCQLKIIQLLCNYFKQVIYNWPTDTLAYHSMQPLLLIIIQSVNIIVRELSRFIAAGRLHCKIDKVGGIVETNRPDSKNWQYQVCNVNVSSFIFLTRNPDMLYN